MNSKNFHMFVDGYIHLIMDKLLASYSESIEVTVPFLYFQ